VILRADRHSSGTRRLSRGARLRPPGVLFLPTRTVGVPQVHRQGAHRAGMDDEVIARVTVLSVPMIRAVLRTP
jgi:hypothetical protein